MITVLSLFLFAIFRKYAILQNTGTRIISKCFCNFLFQFYRSTKTTNRFLFWYGYNAKDAEDHKVFDACEVLLWFALEIGIYCFLSYWDGKCSVLHSYQACLIQLYIRKPVSSSVLLESDLFLAILNYGIWIRTRNISFLWKNFWPFFFFFLLFPDGFIP